MHRLAHLRPPCAAGLWPRGIESDQSDQSTGITVIPEVRGRAPGHTEFTHPTQAPDKSVPDWQSTSARRSAAVAVQRMDPTTGQVACLS